MQSRQNKHRINLWNFRVGQKDYKVVSTEQPILGNGSARWRQFEYKLNISVLVHDCVGKKCCLFSRTLSKNTKIKTHNIKYDKNI